MEAIRRDDEHHVEKHESILMMIKNRPIETIIFGDSLIRRWEDHPLLWEQFFTSFAPANLGVGGDRLEHMKWRLLNGQIAGLSPKVFLFLGGTNNLPDQKTETISTSIKELIEFVKTKLPEAHILLLGLLPRSGGLAGRPYSEKIQRINASLKEWATDHEVHFLDLASYLSSDGSVLDAPITDDGLHLNALGYERIGPPLAAQIERLFSR